MLQPTRNSNPTEYRYSFQGQEADNEIKGAGNSVNYKYRMHDPRLNRFFAVDPLTAEYPWNSPYAFSENDLVGANELEGLEKNVIEVYRDNDGYISKIKVTGAWETNQITKQVQRLNFRLRDSETGRSFRNYDALRIESFKNQVLPIGAPKNSVWAVLSRKILSKMGSTDMTKIVKYDGLDLDKTLVNGTVVRFAFPSIENQVVNNTSDANRNIRTKISVEEDYSSYVALFSSKIYDGESMLSQIKDIEESENLAIFRVNEGVLQAGEIDIFYLDNLQMESIRDEVDNSLKTQYGKGVKINHKVSPTVTKELNKKNDKENENFRESVIIRFRVKEKGKNL